MPNKIDTLRTSLAVICSLLLAYMLMIWPLFRVLQPLRPQWLLVIVLFWIYLRPTFFGVFFACFLGILLDLLSGAVLGVNGLLFSLASYLLLMWLPHFRFCSIRRQSLVIGGIVLAITGFHMWLQALSGQPRLPAIYLLSALTSALVWPCFFFVFKTELNRLQLIDSW
ncbi:MAG: rod shape-determining protein MreD [Gammaproteobacteria bacterium RIFCSPHIGHO2_12_FULL_41_15]|nr:MAG: rod shape-determining protein MreD [Gammaproteobacteria bacterium RIFCSPHIGHO2_12_FULL_41_15]